MFYAIARPVAWFFTHLLCRYRVYGKERIPATGPLLVVANHLSWYDPLLFGTIFPRRLWFFTKSEIFRWPVVGFLCRLTGQIPVRRGEGDRVALEQAIAYLRAGRALNIFPEGSVERQEQMMAAHAGVAMLALRTGATILPVGHIGTRRIFRSWLPRVEVRIGEPYQPTPPSEDLSRKAALQALTQEIMLRIADMVPVERRGVYKS